MKHITWALLFGLALLAASCGVSRYTQPRAPYYLSIVDTTSVNGLPAEHRVTMLNFRFDPESLNVMVGDTVMWINQDTMTHTTTSHQNGTSFRMWDQELAPGQTFIYVFDQPGTYEYYCKQHGNMGMEGFIIVTAP